MAKIDDEIEQARSQWLAEAEPFANALTEEAFKKGFPILGSVFSFWKSTEQKRLLREFNNWVLDFLNRLDQRIDNLPEQITPGLNRLAAIAVERILWGASEKKVERFANIVANAIAFGKEDQYVEDAEAFIRALDELTETDIKVLRLLYDHQRELVTENHHVDYNSFFHNDRWRKLCNEVGPLGIQMDDFYARCARLNGYGLVLPLESRTHNFGPSEFAFRITIIGKRLIEMLSINDDTRVAEAVGIEPARS